MAKRQKKRNKRYQGSDAKTARPTVMRLEAVERNKLSQWWFEKKRIAKPLIIAALVILVVSWLLFELVRAIF